MVTKAEAEQMASQARKEGIQETLRVVSQTPYPLQPEPGAGSLYPLYAYDNPIWYSTPQAPTRRPGSPVTTNTLRTLADNCDVLRSAIQHLKREVAAVPIKVVSRNGENDKASQARIKEASDFFSKKGGLGGIGTRRSHFESEVIEDICVIGAAAVYCHPTRGGGIYQAIAIDAATIRPCVDAFGWPGPGEIAYEQWIQGVLCGQFPREQMLYDGLYPKSFSPFFWSPVEWLLHVVNSALRADEWNRTWLTDGDTPDNMYAMPENWTPDQIKKWAGYWQDMNAGQSDQRHKTKWVPAGTQRVGNPNRKDQDFQQFELWLMRRICAIMGVQPASIGFAGEQYKVSQQDSMESTSAFGVGLLLDWRKETYDEVLERNGYDDLETQNVTAREEKATERANRNKTLVDGAIKTINEARAEEGLDPVADGDILLVSSTLRPLEQALEPPPAPVAPGSNPNGKVSNDGDDSGDAGQSGGGDDHAGDDSSDSRSAARAALAQWERKALKRLREGKSAQAAFTSENISRQIKAHLTTRLSGCTSVAAVRALFREAGQMNGEEAAERTAWAERVTAELEALTHAGEQ